MIVRDLPQAPSIRWIVIEPGDSQVSGLPETLDPPTFNSELSARLA
jgi:hypothetical protein